MMHGIGDFIIIGMLVLIALIGVLLVHQIKMIIIEDREFKAFMKELRDEH